MVHRKKDWKRLFLIPLMAVALASILVTLLPSPKAFAYDVQDSPKINDNGAGDLGLRPLGPNDIHLVYVDRNHIKVSFTDGPIFINGGSDTYNSMFGGVYFDRDTDGFWEWVRQGGSGAVDRIDNEGQVEGEVKDPNYLGKLANLGKLQSAIINISFHINGSNDFMVLDKDFHWTRKTVTTVNEAQRARVPIDEGAKPNFNIVAKYDAKTGNIISLDGKRTYVYCESGGGYFLGACNSSDFLKLNGTTPEQLKAGTGIFELQSANGNGVIVAGGANGVAPGGGGGAEGEDLGPTCESENGSGLEWIGCPILRGIDNALESIQNTTDTILTIKTDTTLGPTSELKQSWGVMRNLANVMFLLAGLVAIIATAAGMEFIDAYTLRKVLPRLVIAVIGIQLSWYLMVFAIDAVNIIGNGIDALLLQPFNNGNVLSLGDVVAHANGGTGGGIFTLAATGAVIGGAITLGFFGLLSLAFTTFLTVLIGFFIIILRNLILYITLIFAPIAILAWILPGTEKLWKFWRETFERVLMMYPIIILLFTAGKILAWVSGGEEFKNGNYAFADAIQYIVVIIAFIAPYFLIPFTIRFAGGVVSTLGGFVNDRSKGVFDRNKKKRAEIRTDRVGRAQQNRLWNADKYDPKSLRGRAIRRINAGASIATSNPWDTGRIYAGTAGGKGILSSINQEKFKHTQKMANAMNEAGISVDSAYSALAGNNQTLINAGFKGQIRNQGDLDKAIGILQQSSSESDKVAAQQLRNASNFVLGANQNPDYGRGDLRGAALLNWSSQGFAGRDDIIKVSNGIGGDLGAMVAGQASYAGYKAGRLELKNTYGVVPEPIVDASGKVTDPTHVGAASMDRQKELVRGLKQYEWSPAKGKTVETLAPAIREVASEITSTDAGKREIATSMRQTVAANAMSATDPNSKAEWRKLSRDVFSSEITARQRSDPRMSTDDALEAVLYEKAYGRGGFDPARGSTGGPGTPGGPPGPGGPLPPPGGPGPGPGGPGPGPGHP